LFSKKANLDLKYGFLIMYIEIIYLIHQDNTLNIFLWKF